MPFPHARYVLYLLVGNCVPCFPLPFPASILSCLGIIRCQQLKSSHPTLCFGLSVACDAEGEAALARDGLQEQVRGLKERLTRETDLRAKEAKEFADRLKKVRTYVRTFGLGLRTKSCIQVVDCSDFTMHRCIL